MEAPLYQAMGILSDGVLEPDSPVDGVALGLEGRDSREQDREQDSERPNFCRGGLIWTTLQDFCAKVARE